MQGKTLNNNCIAFLGIYFICFISLYLGLIDGFPLADWLTRLKFVYIIYGLVFCIVRPKKRFSIATAAIFILLIGYILAFSFIFRNPVVSVFINNHFIMMSIYVVMLMITYSEVRRHQCFTEFIVVSFFSIFLFLLVASIMNFSALVLNPFYLFKVVLLDLRVRSDFGISGTSNYVGAFGFVAFILSFIYFYILKIQKKKILKNRIGLAILISDAYLYLVFSSASSRSPIFSLALFGIILFLFKFKKIIKKIWPILICIAIVAFVIMLSTGVFDYIWANSNRVLNITVNQPAFEQVGNFWTGMGYVDNGTFNTTSGFPWGVVTSSLDLYYVYLFYTTGFIGTVWMGIILLFMFFMIIKRRKNKFFPIIFSMYLSLLFYAYWENIILTYRFWPFMILFAIIFMFIDGNVCADKQLGVVYKKMLLRRTVIKNCEKPIN